jgi:hypothetical protein
MKDDEGRRLDSFSVNSATQAMHDAIDKIKMGVRDVNILIVGDPIAAADTTTAGIPLGSWTYGMQAKLHTLFPTHTIDFRQFNNGSSGSYGAATGITGSGARKSPSGTAPSRARRGNTSSTPPAQRSCSPHRALT